jgi:hypothetical protein
VPRPLLALGALGALLIGLFVLRKLWRAYKNRPLPVAVDPTFRIGYNLDFPGEWSQLVPFIDQMKNARAMLGGCPDEEPQCDPASHLDLDEHGWVKSLRYKDDPGRSYRQIEIMFNTAEDRYDAGKRFFVTWQGQGTVVVSGPLDAEPVPGQRRLRFSMPNGTAVLRITSIDPQRTGDYVRDIRIFREDHEALLDNGQLFNPDLLSYLAPFKSLRFMDWLQSNTPGRCSGGPAHGKECYPEVIDTCGGARCVMPGVWSERPSSERASLPSWSQYLDTSEPGRGSKVGGYPIEVLIALANEVGADPQFNMPALYEDEYVKNFAALVRKQLRPDLVARVEYSNEVWNWDFPQAKYADRQGKKLWPDNGTAWVQYFASRTDNLCRIWKEVFAGQEFRLRCLISPQTGWRDLAETVLDCPAWVRLHPEVGSCTRYVDAINITGYFSGCLHQREATLAEWLGEGREVALDRAFEQLDHGGKLDDCEDNLDHTIEGYRFYAQLAVRRGLGLNVYEGGTHFEFDGRADVKKLLVDMTRDVRMKEAYLKNFEGLRAAGGSVFNIWGWIAPNDTWANAENLLDRNHTKYKAVLEYMAEHPPAAR